MNYKNIGKFISKLRKDKNFTQEELASLLNVNNRTISKWENGNSVPDSVYLYELSKVFNISVNELINGKRNPKYKILKFKYSIPLILAFILFLITLLYFISNFNKVKIYDIVSSSQDVSMYGTAYFTQKNILININKIKFEKDSDVRSIKFEIRYKEHVYYADVIEYDKPTSINIAINSLNININNNHTDQNYKYYLNILKADYKLLYTDSNYNENIISINPKFDLLFSNNKILY